jgi:hypothetical protein
MGQATMLPDPSFIPGLLNGLFRWQVTLECGFSYLSNKVVISILNGEGL